MLEKNKGFLRFQFLEIQKAFIGANEVVIYNFLALITVDTNINQFIKVYHIFHELQYIHKNFLNKKEPSCEGKKKFFFF